MNPFDVVVQFERELALYTGAPYAVTTTSCTAALLLAVAWHVQRAKVPLPIQIPKRTYVGVPMSIIHAGGRPTFRDQDWHGMYELKPLNIWDSARWLEEGIYGYPPRIDGSIKRAGTQMLCLSFHWGKTLGIQQGGAILHDDPEADRWLRMARFDGRQEGVAPKDQKEWIVGHHAYMSPETAAAGLVRLANLPRHNNPLPNDDYPDLSEMEIFR